MKRIVPPAATAAFSTAAFAQADGPAHPGAGAEPWCRPHGGRLGVWRGHSVLITDAEGRMQTSKGGFFRYQARFLRRAELRVAGKALQAASACLAAPDHLVAYFLAPLAAGGDAPGPPAMLEVQVDMRVGDTLRLTWRFTNQSLQPVRAPLAWRLDADFADEGEVGSGRRRQIAPVTRLWSAPATLSFECQHPRLRHATAVRFAGPAAFRAEGKDIVTTLELAPRAEERIEIEVAPVFDPAYAAELPPPGDGPSPQDWLADCARLEAADATSQAAWDRAARDLASLQMGSGEGEERFTPAAGFPHYIALFGRDALMSAWQSALLNPATLRGSLSLIGRWTASDYDAEHDAQPGRVLHQRELGPLALLGKNPFLRYYGDHSASGLYLIGLAAAYARSGDRAAFLGARDLALRTLAWMERDGDADGDGLYEYRTTSKHGLKNQGWKDSVEAILYPDGRIAPDPIVVCEVQALFYAAKAALAAAFRVAGDHVLADDLDRQAAAARRRFDETLWMEDEGFVALGLDGQKRQIRSLASNGAECLAYGALDPARAARVAERVMRPDFFSGWGIRTLSDDHPAYNPLGYHIGSVWPCFSALIARGLARYGLLEPFHVLTRALLDATRLFDRHRLPELFGGHARDAEHPHPGLYPEACSPQAWSSGAVILLADTMVGLKPAAPLGAAIIDPKLPAWLSEVTLTGVSLGGGRLDMRLRRGAGGEVRCEVLSNTSGLRLTGPGLAGVPPHKALADFAEAMI